MNATEQIATPVTVRVRAGRSAAPQQSAWREPLSPFVAWAAEERAALPGELLAPAADASLLVEALRDPRAVVERLLDPLQGLSLVLGSVGLILAGTAFFTLIAAAARGSTHFVAQAALAGVNVLMAVAAALGPVYATSILVCARMPMGRLVATLLSSAATAALVLGSLAPVVYVLWRIDDFWAGPLALVTSFAVAGIAGGARIHRLLTIMAEAVTRAALSDPTAELSPDDAFRVGILARVSLMFLGFTIALAFWGFDAFV